MRRTTRFLAVAASALTLTITALAEPPATPQSQPAQPAQQNPWANKFFLPDIGANREQAAPAMITHNFGDVPHGTLCVHKFTITNIYDTPMEITDVRKSCSCLNYVSPKQALKPNETAELIVTMDSKKFVGQNSQTFYVTFGPKFVSTAVIRVSANSRTDVGINPGAITFGNVVQGALAQQSVQIKYSGNKRDWKITEVVAGSGPFETKLTEVNRGGPIRGGAEYQLDVTLSAKATPGAISEQITLKTNDPTNPLIQVGVTGLVTAPIDLSPNKVQLEATVGGEPVTQRILVRAAKPFKVVGVDGEGDGLTVELPASPAALPVQVITVKYSPKEVGSKQLQLRVRTNFEGNASAILSLELEAKK